MRPFKRRGRKAAYADRMVKRAYERAKARNQKNANDENEMWGPYNPKAHKIRHKNKPGKFNDRHSDNRRNNETGLIDINDPYRATAMNTTRSIYENALPNNHTLALANLDPVFTNSTEGITTEKVSSPAYCYTAGEVLEVIALTCLMNVMFWFSIITYMNFTFRRERARYKRWESLESVEIITEDEIKFHENNHYPCCLRRSVSPSEYFDDGFASDDPTPEEDDPLFRRIDGRYSFSRNSCFDDGSQDWGILYAENSEPNWGETENSQDSYSVDELSLV